MEAGLIKYLKIISDESVSSLIRLFQLMDRLFSFSRGRNHPLQQFLERHGMRADTMVLEVIAVTIPDIIFKFYTM